MLALELIRRLPQGGLVASVLGVSMVLTRFVGGPLLRPVLDGHEWGLWIGDVIGTGGHFGYPLGPWLAFPMFGYVLGKLAASNRGPPARLAMAPPGLAAVAVPFALACLMMVARGNGPFRYGTMNFAYLLASFGVLAISLSFVIWLARAPFFPAERWISLSGLRSFAVVPLHYLLLDLACELGPRPTRWHSRGRCPRPGAQLRRLVPVRPLCDLRGSCLHATLRYCARPGVDGRLLHGLARGDRGPGRDRYPVALPTRLLDLLRRVPRPRAGTGRAPDRGGQRGPALLAAEASKFGVGAAAPVVPARGLRWNDTAGMTPRDELAPAPVPPARSPPYRPPPRPGPDSSRKRIHA